MKTEKFRDWLEVIGIFGVIASLIFVGLQMRQTQEIAIANQYQERAALSLEHRRAHLQNNTLLELRGRSLLAQISDARIREAFEEQYGATAPLAIGYQYMTGKAMYLTMDNNHFQYQSGFLSEEAWDAYRADMKGALKNRYVRYLWDESREGYRADFQAAVDQMILENSDE